MIKNPKIYAEALELRRQAAELWGKGKAFNQAEAAAAGLDPTMLHPDYACDAAKPLRAQAENLRARARALLDQASGEEPAATATSSAAAAPSFAPAPSALSPALAAIVENALAHSRINAAVPAVATDTAAQIAARRAEADALEADRLVANICGDPSMAAKLTADRYARQREAIEDAAARDRAVAYEREAIALADQIIKDAGLSSTEAAHSAEAVAARVVAA